MHVSITPLGSKGAGVAAAAQAAVDYLTAQQSLPAGQRGADAPSISEQTTPGGYYADSSESPGRWHGRGVANLIPQDRRESVHPEDLKRLLLNQHPETRERLVAPAGSAGRASHTDAATVEVAESGDPGEILNPAQAAKLIGVDLSYVRQVATKTTRARAQQAVAAENGDRYKFPKTYLDATKNGAGKWEIERGEVERFIAGRTAPNVVMGFDLTYSAPKETSLAWAVADTEGRARIETALQDRAVSTALNYVERQGIRTRHNGELRDTQGMVAASFLHNTSRELEPQLHVHVVVANLAQTGDGTYQAIDSKSLHNQTTTSGYLADAEFQIEANSLGYAHGETEKGISHLVGFSDEQVKAFSSRRTQIMEEVGAVGVDSPRARQLAAVATRAAKNTAVDLDDLRTVWRQELDQLGFKHKHAAALTSHDAPRLWTPQDQASLERRLEGLITDDRHIFDRRHAIHAITDHSAGRLSSAEIEASADAFLVSDRVIKLQQNNGTFLNPLPSGKRELKLPAGMDHFTTHRAVNTERRIEQGFLTGLNQAAGQVDAGQVAAAIATWEQRTRHTLGNDQAAMVKAITTSGHRIQAVNGPAGSGKTAALEVAARAWESAGYQIHGAAVNGLAAEVLQRETGVESTTVAGLVKRLNMNDADFIGPNSIVIVDETSTLGNNDYAALIRHVTNRGATLRTIGDPAQHDSVDSGGMWSHLANTYHQHTPELTENRRMVGDDMADMRLAAADYRNGLIEQSLERIDEAGRIVQAATSDELLDQLAADWYVDWQRHTAAPDHIKPSRMMAENHVARTELNARAQVLLKADGTLTGRGVELGDSIFHVGDQVVARKQNRQLRAEGAGRKDFVKNGSQGTVIAIGSGNTPDLVVDFDGKGPITVPNEWLTTKIRDGVTGGLTPAYAMTTRGAQGDTFHTGRGLLTDNSQTEAIYVALSRGQTDMRLYAVDAAQFTDISPAAEHGLPVLTNQSPLDERIVANLTRGKPGELATVVDTDIGAVMELQNQRLTLSELENLNTPIADRVADMHIDRITHQTINQPPPQLVVLAGERNPTDPQRWDNAAAAYALYHERWNLNPTDGQLSALPNPTNPAQTADYKMLRSDIIEARAHNNLNLTPADLAATRARIVADLNTTPQDPGVTATISELHDANITTQQTRIDRLEGDLASASKPRQLRKDPNGPEVIRRELVDARGELALYTASREDFRSIQNTVPASPERTERAVIELGVVDNLIDRHATNALTKPTGYRTAAIGQRPDDPDKAARWDTAATSIERYRIGVKGTGPEQGPAATGQIGIAAAIGVRPAGPAANQWDQINKQAGAINNPAITQSTVTQSTVARPSALRITR